MNAAVFKKHWFYFVLALIAFAACVFRIESYFLGREFWHDEAFLAVNFIENDGLLWVFQPLNCEQAAPPLFLFCTKILTLFFGAGEKVLRLIPFFSSLASVFGFLFLSLKFLKTKKAVIFANCLFAVNFPLIRYASEFKQYSSDVLISIFLALLIFKLDFEKLNSKGFFLMGLGFAVLFFLSQPSCFFLFGILLLNLLQKRPKALWAALLPAFAVLAYKFSMPKELADFMYEWWNNCFLSPKTALFLLKENFNFFHYGQKYLVFLSPLCFVGFLIFCFKKDAASKIVLFTLLGVVLASIFRQYPGCGRLLLFTVPFLIIFTSTALDFEIKKFGKVFAALIIALGLSFPLLYGGKFICKSRAQMLQPYFPKSALSAIKAEIQKDDFLIVPKYLKPYYTYYSAILGFKIQDEKLIEYDSEDLDKIPDILQKGGTYWVYIPMDFTVGKVPRLKESLQWAKTCAFEERVIKNASYVFKIVCF